MCEMSELFSPTRIISKQPANSPDCLIDVVTQPTDSRLSETSTSPDDTFTEECCFHQRHFIYPCANRSRPLFETRPLMFTPLFLSCLVFYHLIIFCICNIRFIITYSYYIALFIRVT